MGVVSTSGEGWSFKNGEGWSISPIFPVSSINPATGLITDAMNDTLTFTSFERVNTISEGTHSAQIKYNCDNQRIKMILQQSGSTILTRLYIGESYMKEISIGGEKQYSYIGGDAYSAPAVAITQNGITKYYYLLRDHLGSITHIIDSLNSVIAEYSYDAWGRMRNPATLDCFSPNTEPTLLTGRGFTGHEHMPWFKTINMNGRLYDPLSGQFLSVDNFIQTPTFSQSFNRFGYCMNNPLKYNDPSGNYSVPSPKFFGDDNGSGSDGYDLDNDLYGNPIVDIGLNSGSSSAINTGNIDAIINALMSSNYGGFWSESNGGFYYTSDLQAYIGGSIYKSKYSGERRANTNRLELSSGNVDYSLTADLEGAGQPSEGAYYPNGIIFSQAVEHARYGGGTEISMPLSAVDLSKVKVSDFAGEGKVLDVDLGFGGKYKTNWNDALVHGTISLQLIKDNIVRIAPGSDTRFNCDVGAKNNHPWFGPNHQFKRNTLTVLLDFYLSDNRVYGYKPFNINYLGTATISYD